MKAPSDKIHLYIHPTTQRRVEALCGLTRPAGALTGFKGTRDPSRVTCKTCKGLIKKHKLISGYGSGPEEVRILRRNRR